jgi:hypothetical protein
MPPRRSARVAELRDPSHNALPPLPLELVWLVFALVPVDQRLLLNAVCRSWRAALREASLWRELDFSLAGGVTRRVTREMINAAARYARGQLRLLDLRDAERADVTCFMLSDLVRRNAGKERRQESRHG